MYKHKHCSALKDHLTYMQILQAPVCSVPVWNWWKTTARNVFWGTTFFTFPFLSLQFFCRWAPFLIYYTMHTLPWALEMFYCKNLFFAFMGRSQHACFQFFSPFLKVLFLKTKYSFHWTIYCNEGEKAPQIIKKVRLCLNCVTQVKITYRNSNLLFFVFS